MKKRLEAIWRWIVQRRKPIGWPLLISGVILWVVAMSANTGSIREWWFLRLGIPLSLIGAFFLDEDIFASQRAR
jgi:hypothetical protein